MAFSLSEGEFLVKNARRAIEQYLREKRTVRLDADEKFKKKLGVFVTLETYPGKELRGCIGYPYPTEPLMSALANSAVSAAVHDPRFPAVSEKELKSLVIEVTVLGEPEPIELKDRKKMPSEIIIGKHGLIIEYGPFSGLLLPQVATEYKWSAKEFLSQVCWKAGLSPDMWLDKNARVSRFWGQLFAEESPGGKVIEK